MDNLEESLFSLELFVEKLSISGVPCRFPALAFRLLDYPTLIIYHVDPDLADTIRSKISADHYKLGPHIPELQDKHGNYVVKKGKSCLFKTSARHLCDNLSTTPLYVMLMDTYPEVPKLLGSFGIPLDSCMGDIAKDIEKHGIATPSTHGEKGDYKIYNLMGTLVGRVSVGFRLLSLGPGLLAHIPENAVLRPKVSLKTKPKETIIDEKASHVINENLDLLTKNVQVSIPNAKPKTNDQIVQTVNDTSLKTANQLESKSNTKPSKLKKPKKVSKELDNVIVTNVDCPPPLFYNSQAAEPDLEHYSYGLTLFDNLEATTNNKTSSKDQEQNSSESDEDTIRQEDKFDDSDAEDLVDFKASKIYKNENDFYPLRAPQSFHRTIIRGGGSSIVPKSIYNLQRTGHLPGLPILNALLQEILALQEMQTQPGIRPQLPLEKKKLSVFQESVTLQKLPGSKQEQEASEGASPEPITTGRHTHRSCTAHELQVPKEKSWLRSRPSLSIKKSKLTYGLTNTQRLRLAKANPELLKTLEEQEALRLANRRKMGKDNRTNPPQSSADAKNISTDNTVHAVSGNAEIPSEEQPKQRSPRPPKPTPRLSKQYTRERLFSDMSPEPSLAKQSSISQPESALSYTLSIDIQAPSKSQEVVYDDQESASESDSYHSATSEGPGILGITRTIPTDLLKDSLENSLPHNVLGATSAEDVGFQKMVETYSDDEESNKQPSESRADENNDYSTDEDQFSDSGLEPQLRKVLDTHSEDEMVSPVSTGYEPSLRKVMDQYSDTDDAPFPVAAGYEPALRKVVDQYSESESSEHSQSIASAREQLLKRSEPDITGAAELNKTTSLGHPDTSENSPVPANKTSEFGTTRTALDLSNQYDTQDSPNSTAYIAHSQVPSDTGTSLDSTGEWRKRAPKPSPRRKIDKMSSIHTDSVSSYAPSEPDNISPEADLDEDAYSDDFDENDSLRNQNPRDLKVASDAKLGYTWT